MSRVLRQRQNMMQPAPPAPPNPPTPGKNKDAYRKEHQSTFILHEAAARALKAHTASSGASKGGTGYKLPNPTALQAGYVRLTEKKNTLRVEYGKLQQMAKEYGIVKKNVDSILNPGTERARGRERQAEL